MRGNEVFLFSQPRPVRSLHADGWTPRTLADRLLPAMRGAFTPLETSGDVFNWDPE